jgi:hypothetical protein
VDQGTCTEGLVDRLRRELVRVVTAARRSG